MAERGDDVETGAVGAAEHAGGSRASALYDPIPDLLPDIALCVCGAGDDPTVGVYNRGIAAVRKGLLAQQPREAFGLDCNADHVGDPAATDDRHIDGRHHPAGDLATQEVPDGRSSGFDGLP